MSKIENSGPDPINNEDNYNRAELARFILRMRYGELAELGDTFCFMTHDGDTWDLSRGNEWASMLHAWAESYVEDIG